MPVHRLKHSFTAGELSPLMNDRVDFDRFQNGCRKMYNAICLSQGPATRRPAMKYVADITALGLDTSAAKIRQIPFIYAEDTSYSMIFFQHTDGKTYMVLGYAASTTVDKLVVGTNTPCTYDFQTVVEVAGAGNYNFYIPNGVTVNTTDVVHTAEDGTVTALTVTTDYVMNYTGSPEVISITAAGGAIATDGYVTLTINITVPAVATDAVVTLEMPTNWDLSTFDYAQSGDEVYISQSGLRPHIIRRHADDCWDLVSVTFRNQPSSWSDTNGWPEVVTFHQQRLIFASTILKNHTVWTSASGDFHNFGRYDESAASDADAITFTLNSGNQNKIKWLQSSQTLNIGTRGNEWTVSGSIQTALTPTNILAQRQTNNGSEFNKPLLIGLTTMFVERHGRVINEFVYDYSYDRYKTSDMAILSPHITEQYSIIDWTYQQSPDSIIWCVREDGWLLGITYQREHKVVGWHRHETEGSIKAITCTPGLNREDDVWLIVARTINSTTKYYLEKLDLRFTGTLASESRFLDCFYQYSGAATDTVTAAHLLNETVSVLADGTVHADITLDGSGEGTLDGEYETIVVGINYESEIEPTLPDLGLSTGTILGRTQRITTLNIDFYKTLGCAIVRIDQEDGEQEEEIPFRVPSDLTGVEVPLYTGYRTIDFHEGYDRQTRYTIKQTQPLPMTIISITDIVEVTE